MDRSDSDWLVAVGLSRRAPRWLIKVATFGMVTAAALVLSAATARATGAAVTTLVSVSMSGGGGNGASTAVAVTPDGRYVLFNSRASNLVAGDTNGKSDVFVRDLIAGRTYRVDLGPRRRQANANASGTAISANGRYVVFTSAASNLTRRRDTNRAFDVFVRDRKTGRTVRVSVPNRGGQFTTPSLGGVVSDDGRWVAFTHVVNGDAWHTDLRDRERHTTHPIDAGPAADDQPVAISSDGRYILILFQDHQGKPLYYHLRDHIASRAQTVPLPASDVTVTNAVMTPDATYVSFTAVNSASGGDDALRWRRGSAASITIHTNNTIFYAVDGLSADGAYLAYSSQDPNLVAGDTNGATDVFRDDLTAAITIRASLSTTGTQLPTGGDDQSSREPRTILQGIQGNLTTADGTNIVFNTTSQAVSADTNTRQDVYIRGPL
jgi:Tol biopolymer transport system component